MSTSTQTLAMDGLPKFSVVLSSLIGAAKEAYNQHYWIYSPKRFIRYCFFFKLHFKVGQIYITPSIL
ncbi:unnamed protein product [Cuscuta campestris]|uniref:Uncharacterized protein n=1 Tax=Cuscuta campestris TaxID=132261 RepID=A0A484L1I9_9ASTE|nr:unnamed protein product [Cuscuta campestris]